MFTPVRMNRYRESESGSGVVTGSWLPGGQPPPPEPKIQPVVYSFLTYPHQDMYEEASDLPSTQTRASWNPFFHYKWEGRFISQPVRIGTWLYAYYPYGHATQTSEPRWGSRWNWVEGTFGRRTAGLPQLYEGDMLGNGDLPRPSWLDNLVHDGLSAVLPQIRPRLSVLNSLYELKDMRSLPRTMQRIDGMVSAFKTVWSRVRDSRPLRRILGGGSDVYLQTQFNIIPLLSDMSGVYQALQEVRSKVAEQLANDRKWRIRHFDADVRSYYPDVDQYSNWQSFSLLNQVYNPFNLDPIAGQNRERRQVSYPSCKFHLEVEYCSWYSRAQIANSELYALLDAFGFNLNPQIIWNAIPWSFAVDWLVRVNAWLGQWKSPWMEPTTVIRRMLYSVKLQRNISVSLHRCYGTKFDSGECPIIESKETTYKRWISHDPNVSAALTSSGLNLKEFSLASALGLSRLR